MNACEIYLRHICKEGGVVSTETLAAIREHLTELTADREAHELTIEAARNNHCSDDVEIDDVPTLSIGDEGVWVSAWVWVPIETEDEDEEL